jgi:hypothetical protein
MSRGWKQNQQANAPTPQAAPPAPAIDAKADRIVLTRPTIRLASHQFVTRDKQVQSLEPQRAYIAHGVLVVEELNLWFPLNEIKLGSW